MQFTLLIYGTESAWDRLSDTQRAQFIEGHEQLIRDLIASGVALVWGAQFVAGKPVPVVRKDAYGAKSVNHERLDADSESQLVGIYVIEVPSHDEALTWAKRVPLLPDGGSTVYVCEPEQLICPTGSH